MDLKVCGILDIVILVGFLIALVLGYKKGFLKRVLSFLGIIVIILFAFLYCGQLSEFLIEKKVIAPSIYENFVKNITTAIENKNLGDDYTVKDVLIEALSIPSFFADMLVSWIGSNDSGTVIERIAEQLTSVCVNVISFFIIVFGVLLIEIILKIIASILRNNKLIRFIDGTLGALMMITIYMLIVCGVLALLKLMENQEWLHDFLVVDLQLDNDNFRLTKYIYNGNIISKFFELFN